MFPLRNSDLESVWYWPPVIPAQTVAITMHRGEHIPQIRTHVHHAIAITGDSCARTVRSF